jgi:diguanylate cyclase (GGDEF)-like protein
VLRDLEVLDRPPDAELDALTRLAAHVCGTPRAEVNLIDAYRQWQAAAYGAAPTESDRDDSMCGFSIMSRDVTYTPDASRSEQFADNPHVTGVLDRIRLYVAAPLVTTGGHVVGTLCAFAPEPVELSAQQLDRMRDLAATLVHLLELRRSAGMLARAATRDTLTGLPNRTLLVESVERAVARRSREITVPSVLFVDLDGFKQVNDEHGHLAGDDVLREVARRLVSCVRATDVVGRLAGDEFVVLIEDPAVGTEAALRGEGAHELARRVRSILDFTMPGPDGAPISVRATVGVARAEPSDSSSDLLKRADAAMYAQKREAHRR